MLLCISRKGWHGRDRDRCRASSSPLPTSLLGHPGGRGGSRPQLASVTPVWDDFLLTPGVSREPNSARLSQPCLPTSPRALSAALETLGHPHRLLIPTRLAGVLETGELAVSGGAAVLINDALLGEAGRAAPSAKCRAADLQCPGRLRTLKCPRPQPLLTGPPGWSQHLPSQVPCSLEDPTSMSHNHCLCAISPHIPGWVWRLRAGLAHGADGFNKC